jgi:hypothetical protein
LEWRPLYKIIFESYYIKDLGLRIPPKEPHGKNIYLLLEKIRNYFSENSTNEILEEIRPMMCPHDHVLFRGTLYYFIL